MVYRSFRERQIVQRIFLGLASVAILLLLANAVVGIIGGDFNAASRTKLAAKRHYHEVEFNRTTAPEELNAARQDRDTADEAWIGLNRTMNTHRLLGVGAALVTILVCCVSVTYFVGTSRWSKEVVDTYHLAPELAEESARIKRRSFPWSLLGILTMLGVVALGAAADPSGMNHVQSASWVQPHYLTALGSIGVIGWSFLMQGQCLAEHFALIEKIMGEVRRIREQRGLASTNA